MVRLRQLSVIALCLSGSALAGIPVEKQTFNAASHTTHDHQVFQYPAVVENQKNTLRHSLAVGDLATFNDAVGELLIESRSSADFNRVLKLAIYGYPMGLTLPPEVIERADPQESSIHHQLGMAIAHAQRGDLKPVREMLGEIDLHTPMLSEQFTRGFLLYLIAKTENAEPEAAIAAFSRLESNEEAWSAPTLLGVARLHKAELHLMLADEISKPKEYDQDELIELYWSPRSISLGNAFANAAAAYRDIDAVEHPGLWKAALEQALEIKRQMLEIEYEKLDYANLDRTSPGLWMWTGRLEQEIERLEYLTRLEL